MYGTETGQLTRDGQKLAHIDEYQIGRGRTTVAVNDSRYAQALPFDVQTTGNVRRWIQMNPVFKKEGDFFFGPYGLRGGSWYDETYSGCAAFRGAFVEPGRCSDIVGFTPVVVPSTP